MPSRLTNIVFHWKSVEPWCYALIRHCFLYPTLTLYTPPLHFIPHPILYTPPLHFIPPLLHFIPLPPHFIPHPILYTPPLHFIHPPPNKEARYYDDWRTDQWIFLKLCTVVYSHKIQAKFCHPLFFYCYMVVYHLMFL